MKFKSILLSLIAVSALVVSCNNEPDPLEQSAKVEITSGETLELSKTDDTGIIAFIATRNWKINGVPEWISIDPEKGEASVREQKVEVAVLANAGKGRTATLTIIAGNKSATVTVHQVGEIEGEDDGSITVAEFIEKADRTNAYTLTGTLTGLSNSSFKGFDLTDETGKISIAFPTNFDQWVDKLANGGLVSVKGVYTYYEAKSQHEMEKGEILSFEAGPVVIDPSHDNDIYFNAFDAKIASQNSNKQWPFLNDNLDMWNAHAGTGVANVTYATSGTTLRSNSTSDSSYSDYKGSGSNNVFFGTNGYIEVLNIDLGTNTNLALSFGTEKYDNNNKEALFNPAEMLVYASNDGAKWVALNYTYKGTAAGRWNLAECNFSVPSGTSKLYLYIKATVASVYRLDDLCLAPSATAGTVLDFSKGVDLGTGGGTGDDGGGSSTGEPMSATGTVVALSNVSFLVKTSSGFAYAFDDKNAFTVKVGDNVTVDGEKEVYNDVTEIKNFTIKVNSSNNPVSHPAATTLDATAFDALTTANALWKFYTVRGKLSISGTYYNFTVPGASKNTGSLVTPAAGDVSAITALNNKFVDVTGYFAGISGGKYANFLVTSFKESADQTEVIPGADLVNLKSGETAMLELTNEDIIKVVANNASGSYQTVTFADDSGNWVGNVNTTKPGSTSPLTYLQMRDNNASYLTSPQFTSNVSRVVFEINDNTVTPRALHCVPVVNPSDLPTGKDASGKNNLQYDSAVWASEYGSASVGSNKTRQYIEASFGSNATKQFSIVAGEGAVYIRSIKVFLK